MTIIEELALRLRADGDAQVKAALAGVDKSVDKLAANFGKMLGAYLGVQFWKGIIDGTVNTAIELSKLSEQTGATVEDLSRLRFAADLADVSHESLTTGLKFLTKAMQGVDLDSGKAKDALVAMFGATKAAELAHRPLIQVLQEVSTKFASYADGSEKGALAMSLLGRSGQDMIPIMNLLGGPGGFAKVAAESDKLGNTMSTQDANQLREYDDALDRVKGMLSGVARSITLAVVPALTSLSNSITASSETADTFATMGKLIASAWAGVAFVLNSVGTIIVGLLNLMYDSAQVAGTLLNVLKHPFSKEAWAGVGDAFKQVGEDAKTTLKGLGEEVDNLLLKLDAIQNPEARVTKGHPENVPKKPGAPTLGSGDGDDGKEAPAWDTTALRAQYEYQLTLAQDDYEAKRALALKWFALMQDLYGRNSAEYFKALQDIEQLDQEDEKKNQEHLDKLLAQNVDYWTKTGQQLKDESDTYLAQIKSVAEEMSSALGSIIDATFDAAFSGKGIGGTFKAFGNAVLAGLGGIFKRMGGAWLTYGLTQLKFMAALFTPGGGAWAAIGLGAALIALGATLGAIGGGGGGGSAGGGGGSGFGGSSYGSQATPTATRLIFGENSATTAAGMTPRQATNVTIIGPADPRAQREMQELLNNAARRGG